MEQEFLTKNADTALVEIKEKLYERLKFQREYLDDCEQDEWGHIDFADCQVKSEIGRAHV